MGIVSGGVYDASGRWEPSLANLGVTDAPVPRTGLETALGFFAARMPGLLPQDRFGFLKGMDLHSPVQEVSLYPPQMVAAFRLAGEDPVKLFYTKAGTSLHQLGVNPATRGFVRFRVIGTAVSLESHCTSMRDYRSSSLDRPSFAGGGLQYIIPDARHVLVQER